MRGRKKLFGVAALLSVFLIIPLVFSLGLVDVSQFSIGSSPSSSMVGPMSPGPTPTVFMDPEKIIKDYLTEPDYRNGSAVPLQVHVNISDVTDLFAWQVNITYDTAILNVSRNIPSEFLARSDNLTSSEILGFVINSTGSDLAAEAIMANTTGITGSGRLVTIEFEIVGYGRTNLTISVGGILPTMLLNSTRSSMTFTTTRGYFSNRILGDVNSDGIVDGADFSLLGGAYRAVPGDPNWLEDADINGDGIVDGADFSLAGGNYREEI